MAETNGEGNGRFNRLEEAMSALSQAQTNLVQAQASLAQQQAIMMQNQTALTQNQIAFTARMAENDARRVETDRINAERFARIEAILMEHSRMLRALPEAVREKIGFRNPPPPKSAE